jgi:hypothetical protein
MRTPITRKNFIKIVAAASIVIALLAASPARGDDRAIAESLQKSGVEVKFDPAGIAISVACRESTGLKAWWKGIKPTGTVEYVKQQTPRLLRQGVRWLYRQMNEGKLPEPWLTRVQLLAVPKLVRLVPRKPRKQYPKSDPWTAPPLNGEPVFADTVPSEANQNEWSAAQWRAWYEANRKAVARGHGFA